MERKVSQSYTAHGGESAKKRVGAQKSTQAGAQKSTQATQKGTRQAYKKARRQRSGIQKSTQAGTQAAKNASKTHAGRHKNPHWTGKKADEKAPRGVPRGASAKTCPRAAENFVTVVGHGAWVSPCHCGNSVTFSHSSKAVVCMYASVSKKFSFACFTKNDVRGSPTACKSSHILSARLKNVPQALSKLSRRSKTFCMSSFMFPLSLIYLTTSESLLQM